MNRSHCARSACAAITLVVAFVGCASSPPAKDPAAANHDDSAAVAPANPAATTPHLPLASDASIPRDIGWVAIAIGAEAATVAITTSFLMLHENSARSDQCDAQKVCSTQGLDADAKLKAYAPWNAGSWVLAAVGFGVGAYLVISNPPESHTQTAVGVGPNGSGMGFNLRSTF